MINIKNKIIVISGTSSGIGFFLAKELLKFKCKVIGLSRKKTNIKNKNFFNFCGNILNEDDQKKFLKYLKIKNIKVDVLINNAGISKNGYNLKVIKENIDTNFISTFSLTEKLIHLMKKNGGSIINVSSIASLYGFPNNPGYNASKAALNSLTKSLANDYAKYNIRCNSLLLGYFKSKMTMASYNNPQARKIREKHTVLNRWGKYKEILGPVLFLSSKHSNYITGQNLIVDGGWTIKGFN